MSRKQAKLKSKRKRRGSVGANSGAASSTLSEAGELLRKQQFSQARHLLAERAQSATEHALHSVALIGCDESAAASQAVDEALSCGLTDAGVLMQFGAAWFKQGDWRRAASAFEQAARVQPNAFEPCLNLAMAAHRDGQMEVAVQAYDQALTLRPDQFQALYNRGVALKCLQQWEHAAQSLEQAFAIQPQNIDVLCNLGQVAQRLGQLVEARHWFETALREAPANADVLHSLGNVSLLNEQFEEATQFYSRSLQSRPDPEVLNNLGGALVKLKTDSEAKRCFEAALKLAPGHERASENLADLLGRGGEFAEARTQYEQLVKARPDSFELQLKLGRTLRRLKLPQDAGQAFQAALSIDPQSPEALSEMGMVAFHEGDHAESVRYLDRAIDVAPTNPLYPYLNATSLPVIYSNDAEMDTARAHVHRCLDRMEAGGLRLSPRRNTPNTMFYLAYQGRNDREIQQRVASMWEPCDVVRAKPRNEKIRVGFLTRYLTGHTIGMLTGGLIAKLDPERFESITFAFDDDHPWFRANCNEFHVAPQRPNELIDYVASQSLDVLVFPEIGMDALTNAVARARMAPVQCVMWGHPVTTGIPTIDYFLSSRLLEIDEADDHYSEKLVRLDSLPAYYFRPQAQVELKSRDELGLPSTPVFACPQSLFKFHPEFDPMLDSILEQTPESEVVLVEGGSENWTRQLKQRFAQRIRNHERIRWLPRLSGEDFYALLGGADVVLDPLHFGGGRSNYVTLSAGTPLVTLPSSYMRGRVASAMYEMLDYRACVASSKDDYVRLAVELATNPDYRAAVGDEIQARSDLLFEDDSAVAALESFLESAAGVAANACVGE